VRIKTGVRVELPDDVFALVVPRSSTAKRGIQVHLGTIDSGYRGEILVSASALRTWFDNDETPYVQPGDRIAQLLFLPALRPALEFVDELADTERGADGFGSTGR
jgi:dUTP pyrophosphatase